MSYMETYKEWCTNPYFDENTKAELAAIGDDAAEIEDRFYRQLEFGTGGLRGVIEPHEHLYRASGDTGTGELHSLPERTGEGSGDRPRFQNHVH